MASEYLAARARIKGAARGEAHPRVGLFSDFILGSQDGLVNVLGILLGMAVASQNIRLILAGGLAATFAESVAMGAVAFTSTLARRQEYLSEVEREKREMRDLPHLEREEVRAIFRDWGFEGQELEDIVDRIIAKPRAWLEFMMAYELRLAPVERRQARRSALLVATSALVGSLIPLAPFLVLQGNLLVATTASLAVSSVALFLVGWYRARSTVGRPGRSGLQMVLIGLAAALAGFAIGHLIGALPGG
jgi:VIT1/CCC1 family predicted Fe2+/Mn2+ transporter